MAAIPFYKSVYGTHFLAGNSWQSRSKDNRAMAGATVSYRLRAVLHGGDRLIVISSPSMHDKTPFPLNMSFWRKMSWLSLFVLV